MKLPRSMTKHADAQDREADHCILGSSHQLMASDQGGSNAAAVQGPAPVPQEVSRASESSARASDGSGPSHRRPARAKPVDYSGFYKPDAEEPELPLSKKRSRQEEQEEPLEDEDSNAETAARVGLNPEGLSPEEEGLLPSGAQENLYVQMRNYVLALWRADVSLRLSLDQATTNLRPRLVPYARAAWKFLNAVGFINWGLAAPVKERFAKPAKKARVIVVGAGLAGLSAARQLRAKGMEVVVLEGHSRPGGRVYSKQLRAGAHAAVADLGGSIITGIDGNPLAVLSAQLGIPMHTIGPDCDLLLPDGSKASKLVDSQVEKAYNKVLDGCAGRREDMAAVSDKISLGTAVRTLWEDAEEDAVASKEWREDQAALRRQLLEWHLANLEFANAAEVGTLSLAQWDQDDAHELLGAHCFLPGGNIRLVAALAEGLPILYNSPVQEVRHCSTGVAVRTPAQEFRGDAVVVTVPLGVLKKGSIAFSPPLPARKQGAIHRLGFGLLNKVVLLFPTDFWGEADMFGRVPVGGPRGHYFLFYSYSHLSGGAVLAALVSGRAAARFEDMPLQQAVAEVMAVLQAWFAPRGISVPEPLQAVATRWGKDEMALGSYSSIPVGSLGGEDYDLLAESTGRLFFAGEATTKQYPATMHGAFASGMREAANVAAFFARQAANERRKAAASQGTGLLRQTLGQSAVEHARVALQLSVLLSKVFGDPRHPPDAEFGCCALVYGPDNTEFEGEALLRVDVGAARGGRARSLPLHFVLPADQAVRLRDVVGGDDARLAMLAGPLATKLVGRESSRPALELLASVLSARGMAVPNLPQALGAGSVELAATVSTPQAEDAREFGQPVLDAGASDVMGSAGLGGLGSHQEQAVQFAQGEQPMYDAGWYDPSSGSSGLPPGLS